MIEDIQISVIPEQPKPSRGKAGVKVGHKPWGPAALNANKTHCIRGHEFTPENTVRQPTGRMCRICRNEAAKLAMRKRVTTPESRRARNLKTFYGMTMEQYEAMNRAQNGLCAICMKSPTKGIGKKLYVDHCHKTNKVRGLLCNRCNSAIGLFDENPLIMRWAINYILEFQRTIQQ